MHHSLRVSDSTQRGKREGIFASFGEYKACGGALDEGGFSKAKGLKVTPAQLEDAEKEAHASYRRLGFYFWGSSKSDVEAFARASAMNPSAPAEWKLREMLALQGRTI